MSLLIEYRDHRYCPVFFCDHCGDEIVEASDGNYEWRPSDERDRYAVFYTHKHCCHGFEQQRGGSAVWYADELAVLPTYLLTNLKLTADESRESASRLGLD